LGLAEGRGRRLDLREVSGLSRWGYLGLRGRCGRRSCSRWGREDGSEEETLDLAVGHGRLHQLLTGNGDDGHTLWDDLQLALGLALTLDHHRQTWVSTLQTKKESCLQLTMILIQLKKQSHEDFKTL